MNKNGKTATKTNKSGFNLGANGWLLVILAFLSMYCYTALVGDSLNVTISVFGAMGMNTNVLYLMSTVGTVIGVILTMVFGKVITSHQIRTCWGTLMIVAAVATCIWAFVHTTVMYCIVYLITFATTVVASQFLTTILIANWFPRTRGVPIGLVTVAFPLSAASTTSICSAFLQGGLGLTGYYIMMAAIMLIVGILVLLLVRDNPEDKGCFPDNDRNADIEQIRQAHQADLEYQKSSKWTVGKVLSTGRFWLAVLSLVVAAFVCQGVMANFVNKFMEDGYQLPEILGMLTISGLCAIPLSVLIGWLDLKIGTKKTGILVNALAVLALVMLILKVSLLNYIGLPILAVLLGGSNNMAVAIFTSIWGRYDFQNVYRVFMPISNLALGLGISVVGIIGTNFSYLTAYVVLLALMVISLIAMIALKIEPIDKDVHM